MMEIWFSWGAHGESMTSVYIVPGARKKSEPR